MPRMFGPADSGFLSSSQQEKILKQKPGADSLSSIEIHGRNFYYNDPRGLLHSVDEIFNEQIYRFKTSSARPLIIDCGSNIGLSILFFKLNYPSSRVTAFEPDPYIYKILNKNIESFALDDVVAINKGIWNKEEKLQFFSEKSLAGSFTTDFSGNNDTQLVDTISLKSYLSQEVDFLKIDIEGAELEVLKDIKDSLSCVKQMFIEYHSLKSGEQELDVVLKIIKEAGFRYYVKDAINLKNYNPFFSQIPSVFDLQLNIFCTRL